jgi:hypothetical protein
VILKETIVFYCNKRRSCIQSEEMRALVEASGEVRFQASGRRELNGWVSQILRGQDYGCLKRASKRLVWRYLALLPCQDE